MRSLHRCWHVTSRTFRYDDDDVYHDDVYHDGVHHDTDVDDTDVNGDGCGEVLDQAFLLKEKLNIICFKFHFQPTWQRLNVILQVWVWVYSKYGNYVKLNMISNTTSSTDILTAFELELSDLIRKQKTQMSAQFHI